MGFLLLITKKKKQTNNHLYTFIEYEISFLNKNFFFPPSFLKLLFYPSIFVGFLNITEELY